MSIPIIDAGRLAIGSGFFALAKSEYQINNEPDKRYRSDDPPLCLFAGGAKIFLGNIDDGPYGGNKKGDTEDQKYAEQFQAHAIFSCNINLLSF